MASSIVRMRPENRARSSISSHDSKRVRHMPGRSPAIPFRISPSVRTLKKSRSSSTSSSHAMTLASGLGFMSSEMTFVSSRNPFIARPVCHNQVSCRARYRNRQVAIGRRIERGSPSASCAWRAGRTLQPESRRQRSCRVLSPAGALVPVPAGTPLKRDLAS